MMTSPTRPIAWLSDDIMLKAPRSCRMSSAAIVSRRMRLSAKATSSGMRGSRWWHTISMSRCSSTVLIVNGRVGLVDDGKTFGSPHNLMMSGAWPPPGPFGVEGVDVAALEGGDRVLDKARFVERVGVDRDRDVELLGDTEAGIDRRRGRAPILVQFEPAGAGLDHLDQGPRVRGVALAEEAEIDRQPLGRLQHAGQMPGARRAGRRGGAGGRPGAAAEHRRDAAVERLLDQLRADQMDVRVDAAGGDDAALAGDRLGPGPDHDVDPGLDVRVAGLADAANAAVADADIGFDDAPMVENHRVGDDGVDRALGAGRLALPHAVADHLAAAELDFLAIDRAVALDLDDELGVGQPQPIAGRRAEHCGIGVARDASSPLADHSLPLILPLKPTTRRSPA